MSLRPIIRDRTYLDFLRTEPCLFTGRRGSDNESVVGAHIGTAGKSIKSSDDEAVPVINGLHQQMHSEGEITTIRREAPDWLIREAFRAYARQLYAEWKAR